MIVCARIRNTYLMTLPPSHSSALTSALSDITTTKLHLDVLNAK